MKLVYWTLAVGLLSGCASLSKEECQSADWFVIGLEDGSAGKSLETIGQHRKACAKIAVTPDFSEYERGHTRGLARYCTAENGFMVGRDGGQLTSVCANLPGDFLQGFHAGKSRHEAQQQLATVSALLTQQEQRLGEIDGDIRQLEAALISPESTSRERRQYLQSLRSLQDEKAAVESERDLLGQDLSAMRYQLDELIGKQRAAGYP